MIKIGRLEFGFAAVSTFIVFIVLSICAITSAFSQECPESPMPLGSLLIINEGLALLATLIFGIFAHFALLIIRHFSKNPNK
ncbi:MAG: hypothetical protein K2M04_01445 [Muribaculaceae bacterium]|nr:hypothetical protein [Muribaculaceae bacterium]